MFVDRVRLHSPREGILRRRMSRCRNRLALSLVPALVLLCTVEAISRNDVSLKIFSRSNSMISGGFSSSGDGLSANATGLLFDLRDAPDSFFVNLRRRNGDNLLRFSVPLTSTGSIHNQPNEYSVLGRNIMPELTSGRSSDLEFKLLSLLRITDEYRLLPRLAFELGSRYNITGKQMKSAFAFYQIAMDAESEMHKSLRSSKGGEEQIPAWQNAAHHRRRRWLFTSNDATFKCPSPSGKCSKKLLAYKRRSDCHANGSPITFNMYANNCLGLCGPGCKCWEFVCGDCCKHHGCLKHDLECRNNHYGSCLTGKGVIWGAINPSDIC